MSPNGHNRVAIVTGGTSGIGLDIVSELHAAGYRVAFVGSSQTKLDEALAELPKDSDRLWGLTVDMRENDEIAEFITKVKAKWGPVSTLVYSAGVSPKRDGVRIPIHETSMEQWDEVMQINLTGALTCCQHVLPEMMTQQFGRIVFIGSVAGRTLSRFAGSAYVASKAGLSGLGRAIAGEYGQYGITCNMVSPGNVATKMTGGPNSKQNIESAARIPVGRIGVPEDFGALTVYLCSDQSGFINGATIDVTGGEYMFP